MAMHSILVFSPIDVPFNRSQQTGVEPARGIAPQTCGLRVTVHSPTANKSTPATFLKFLTAATWTCFVAAHVAADLADHAILKAHMTCTTDCSLPINNLLCTGPSWFL